MCYRCFWPASLCWCSSLSAMETRTRFVFLMHPKEFKEEKAGTGRLTRLSLANSEIHMGKDFTADESVVALIADPANFPVLLYPGVGARNLSHGELVPADLGGRRLVVFLLDATWAGARKMLRLSPNLQALPRIMFTPTTKSRYVIKQQPQEGCLSTLEAVHELLLNLEASGLDQYPLPEQLLGVFQRMQNFQLQCAADPNRGGYRRRPYSAPEDRVGPRGRSARRQNVLKTSESGGARGG
ncbi:MAG: tRNA-uridine aminocarboxypropyltransferase [Candidatus Didemnitutus sp.]|nr:tRNA-uridine aminocarboxypropyltransferase [Candidatus Didemnitutus sp.]